MTEACSIVITSFNRPRHLERLFRYLYLARVGSPLLLADWSTGAHKADIAAVVRRWAGRLELTPFDYLNEVHPFVKVSATLRSVRTRYSAVLNEDDFLTADGIRACIKALDEDPFLSVAQGEYYRFQVHAALQAAAAVHLRKAYDASPVMGSGVEERLMGCASRRVEYLSAMFRSESLRRNYEEIVRAFFGTDSDSRWASDEGFVRWSWAAMLLGFLASVDGGLGRVPVPYCFRETHAGKLTLREFEWGQIVLRPQFNAQLRAFHSVLEPRLMEAGAGAGTALAGRAWDAFQAMALAGEAPREAGGLWARVKSSLRFRAEAARCSSLRWRSRDVQLLLNVVAESAAEGAV